MSSTKQENIKKIDKIINDDSSFLAKFNNSSSFSRWIEFLKGICNVAHFVFYKDEIVCKETTCNVFVSSVIYIDELIEYEYHSSKEMIIVAVEIDSLKNMLKNISKKSPLTLYKVAGDRQLYVSTDSNGNWTGTLRMVDTSRFNLWRDPKFDESSRPNCTIIPGEFSTMCTGIIAMKPTTVEIITYKEGITVHTRDTEDSSTRVYKFGKFPKIGRRNGGNGRIVIEMIEINKYKISTRTLKSLSKMSNLSPGNIKIYSTKDSPLMMSTGISVVGKVNVYVKMPDKEEK